MSDRRYQPRHPPYPASYDRDGRYDSSGGRYDQYGQFTDRQRPLARDEHRSGYDERYDRRPPDYSFRGAASRESYDSYRPQETFTFRASGPPAPQFSPSDRYAPPPGTKPRKPRHTAAERARREQAKPAPGSHRSDRTYGVQGRGGFKPKPAHIRDILQRARGGSTPEQLRGMDADGKAHFVTLDSSGDEELVDLTYSSDDCEEGELPRKRVKTSTNLMPEAAPKWSNPDPYTALPPPDTLGAPKKDIVQFIRKAKIEVAAKSNSANDVKNNADFISLNFDEDSDADDMTFITDAASTGGSPVSARPQKSKMDVKFGIPPKPPPPDLPPPPPGLLELTDQYDPVHHGGGQAVEGFKGKKRKREEQSKGTGEILPEWKHISGDPTPWSKVGQSPLGNAGHRLHKEIMDFYNFVRPYHYEEAARRDLIGRVQYAVRTSQGGKNVEMKCFGSFAAGLYLPTADMDLVALSPRFLSTGQPMFCQSGTKLHNLGRHLVNTGIAAPGTLSVVTRAKVPLVKFTDKTTGIKVDISFENISGLQANTTFDKWKKEYPDMPLIVVLIKQMLAMRGLNEVFTGGLGGFSIICLVVNMMQMGPDSQASYDQLLLTFLNRFGNQFDIQQRGITMVPPGYFDKIRNPRKKQNANTLTIIDPNNPDNDISGGSREIRHVLRIFSTAHVELQHCLARVDAGQDIASILGCVWGGNYTSFKRQRNVLSMLQRGRPPTPPLPPIPQQTGNYPLPPKPQSDVDTSRSSEPEFQSSQRTYAGSGPGTPTRLRHGRNESRGNFDVETSDNAKHETTKRARRPDRRRMAARAKRGSSKSSNAK